MEGRPAARPFLTIAVLICAYLAYGQEYSVGINTNDPNPSAVLHLVSPNGDQGLLIPQLTTSQRSQMALSNAENGLLVYDASEGNFYYWHNSSWNLLGANGSSDGDSSDEIQQLSKSGNVVSLSKSGGSFTDEVDDADHDPENELQAISKAGNEILLSDGGSLTITQGDPIAGQIIQWNGSNWIPVTPEAAQSLTLNGSVLSITDGNAVDLGVLNDGDGDSTNELQSLSLIADQLQLSQGGPAIDLSPYKDQLTEEQVDIFVANNGYVETELDPTVPEELKDGVDWSELTGIPADFSDGTDEVDDADADPLNEIQDLTLTSHLLSVTNNASASAIDLSRYLDNTDAQDLSLAGNTLSLTGDATAVDLSTYLDNTDEQVLSYDAVSNELTLTDGGTVDLSTLAIDNVDDADADATNEIQDLSLVENSLSITNNPSASTIDLTGYLDNTDAQVLSLDGNQLSLSNGGTVDLSVYATDNVDDADADPANEIQRLIFSNDSLKLSNDPDSTVIYIFDGDFSKLQGIPTGIADGDDTRSDDDIRLVGYGDTNIRQQLSFNSGNGELSLTGSTNSVFLSDWDKDISKSNELIESIGYTSDDTLWIYEGGILHKVEIATSSSDRRLKKDIRPISDALVKITSIGGYNYYLKSDSTSQYLKTGVIAQEVEKVFPSIVKEREDGFKGVTYHELIPILIEALKEQQTIIQGLESEVTDLESSGNEREARITALEGKLEMIMELMTK